MNKVHNISEKRIKIYLVFSSVAITALVIVVTVMALQINDLVSANTLLIKAQQRSNISQCQASNKSRQQDIAIWNRLLRVSPTTAEGKAEVAELKELVRIKDTPRNCVNAFKGG